MEPKNVGKITAQKNKLSLIEKIVNYIGQLLLIIGIFGNAMLGYYSFVSPKFGFTNNYGFLFYLSIINVVVIGRVFLNKSEPERKPFPDYTSPESINALMSTLKEQAKGDKEKKHENSK